MRYEEGLLKDKCVVLGVTGGIAAYKIPNLASALVKEGAEVHVIMTENATNFITPITFETLTKNKCIVSTFDRNFTFEVGHVSLADKADILMIAPATANVIAKLKSGIADDMLTTTALACEAPTVVVPAMNTHMYNKPVTQANVAALREYGIKVITPDSGRLACGYEGIGKMPEPDELLEVIHLLIAREKLLSGKKVLVTAGPTQEAIDPVRFITNHSSGKMGFALAREAARMGADVTLVSGPVSLDTPLGTERIDVRSAKDMYDAVTDKAKDADIIIKAAAVADYRPKDVSEDKLKKKSLGDTPVVALERTDDIIKALAAAKRPDQFICGFSMETKDEVENAREKLAKKKLDMIVSNNVKTEGAGFQVDTNLVTIITADDAVSLPLLSKEDAAFAILSRIARLTEKIST